MAALTDLAVAPGVIVACSGGRDSVALLHAAHAGGHAPRAICIDHGLGPHGARASAHVGALCAAWGVPFRGVRVTVDAGEGPEDAARRARYAALSAESARLGGALVMTAHSADDQIETVLMRFAAGAGARGLAGIPMRRGCYYRPWLGVERAEIAAYAAAHDLTWIDDPTNAARRFLRNRVRQTLVPALEATFGAGWRRGILESARIAQADAVARAARLAEVRAEVSDVGGGLSLPVTALAALVGGERREALLWLCRDLPPRRQRAGIDALAAILDGGGGPLDLAGGFRALRRAGRLWVVPPTPQG